jgi:TetR/AcrR family fatty acid metabolism transcriptional regulator
VRSGNQSGDQTRSFIEQARRAQIMHAAVETIAELGFAKASLVRIAGRAGISPGLISYHFAGKDELIERVVTETVAEIGAAMQRRVGDADTYLDTLRALISGFVLFCAENRTRMYALREIETNGGPAPASDTVGELTGLLADGQRDGEFREFDPRLMAVTIDAALHAVPGQLYTRSDLDPAHYAEELAETFAQAVRRRKKWLT